MNTKKEFLVSTPFDRNTYSSVTNGTVDYSGYLYNNKGPNLTVDEYLKCAGALGKVNPRLVSEDEFLRLYVEDERKLLTNFSEVSEDRYYDALECLPPMKWHDITTGLNIFFISEALTGSLHACLLKDRTTGKFYEATRDIFETDEQLVEVFKDSIKTLK